MPCSLLSTHKPISLFRANRRAHSFRPLWALMKSINRTSLGFVFRAYRKTLDHLLLVFASTVGSDVQKITMAKGSGLICGASVCRRRAARLFLSAQSRRCHRLTTPKTLDK
jgi:hypothetical protein